MVFAPAVVTQDKNLAIQYAMSGNKVVIVDEGDSTFDNVPNTMNASVLLPNYESVAMELDGNQMGAHNAYMEWLNTKECMDYMCLISLAIYRGVPIMLYFGQESKEMNFMNELLFVFLSSFGIKFGYVSADSGYANMNGSIEETIMVEAFGALLIRGIIDIPTYFNMMPVWANVNPTVIGFLNGALNPFVGANPTVEDYNAYYKRLIQQCKEVGTYLTNPIIGGRPNGVIGNDDIH